MVTGFRHWHHTQGCPKDALVVYYRRLRGTRQTSGSIQRSHDEHKRAMQRL
jgi:hypothetical protein